MIPVAKENTRLKPALAIYTRTSITLVKEIVDIPPLVVDEVINVLSK